MLLVDEDNDKYDGESVYLGGSPLLRAWSKDSRGHAGASLVR